MEKKLGDIVSMLVEKKEECYEAGELLIPKGSIGIISDIPSEDAAYIEFEENDMHPACVIACKDNEYEIIPNHAAKRNPLASCEEGDEIVTLVDVYIKIDEKTNIRIPKGAHGKVCEVYSERYLILFEEYKRAINYRFSEVESAHN